MSTKFRQAIRFVTWVIRQNVPGRIALLKSSKQRTQLEVLQVNALMQRFQYCRDLISKEGFEKYNKFCEFLYTIYCRTGERMVRKGEQGTRFYMILQGAVSLVSYKPRSRKAQQMMDLEKETIPNYEDDTLFTPIAFKELNAGDYFGDMSLLDNGQVSCTIICKTFCQFVCMDKQQFVKFIGKSVPVLQKLSVLQEQSVFNCWSDGELRALSYEFKSRIYHQEEFLYQEGQKNTQIYLIMNGHVEMVSIKDGQTYHLSSIDVGSIFGDDLDYHTCSAKCVSARAEILVIGRQVLNRMLDWHPESKQIFRQQLAHKANWRLERLSYLTECMEEKNKHKRTQSIKMQLLDLLIKPRYQKIRLSPCVKRITNIQDTMDFEEKKMKHQEILEKQNLIISQRKIEFFKIGNSDKRKKKQQQKQQLLQLQQSQLDSRVKKNAESTIDIPVKNRASSTLLTKTSQTQFYKLSPVKKLRKVFSIEGTTMNIYNKS